MANGGSIGGSNARHNWPSQGHNQEVDAARNAAPFSGGGLLVETILEARAPESQAARCAVIHATTKGGFPQFHLTLASSDS